MEENKKEAEPTIEEIVAKKEEAFRVYLEEGMKKFNCDIVPILEVSPNGIKGSLSIRYKR